MPNFAKCKYNISDYGFVVEVTVRSNETCELSEESPNACLLFRETEEVNEVRDLDQDSDAEFSAGRTECQFS